MNVKNLCKSYESFALKDVSFDIAEGEIMGFIGRNGAGKTTTLKSLLNLVHPDSGEISFFGMDFTQHESEIKQRIGYAAGGMSYYSRKRLRDIAKVTSGFYDEWSDDEYRRLLALFSLDENKRVIDLSEGMKVKFHLALALSHNAKLLILDEPTSGLDPVSRDELLELFMQIAKSGTAILFSTHITSDLDKCADKITYISGGRIIDSCKTDDFIGKYRLVGISGEVSEKQRAAILGESVTRHGGTALIYANNAALFGDCKITAPDLETIMVHLEKEERTI